MSTRRDRSREELFAAARRLYDARALTWRQYSSAMRKLVAGANADGFLVTIHGENKVVVQRISVRPTRRRA